MAHLMFVMGVQRSGTNALFRSLSADPTVVSFNESQNGPWYEQMLLRPEPELRPHLESLSGTVLLKPISETKHRSVASVLTEFEVYKPRVAWIYRDPVNCFYSHTERWKGFVDDPSGFAAHWCERNRSLLDALDTFSDQIAVVRYGDLAMDPRVFDALQGFLGVRGRYGFRSDRQVGRQMVSSDERDCIDAACAATLSDLDQARCLSGEPMPRYVRLLARVRM